MCWIFFAVIAANPRHGDKLLAEACGPVQTSAGGDFCVGATRATNNTGEMQGLIEGLVGSFPVCSRECDRPTLVHMCYSGLSLYVEGAR